MWAANLSGVQYEFNSVDLMKGEHKTDEYMHLTQNRHCIPCLSHTSDGKTFAMTESRAIARYLCAKGEGVTDFSQDPEKAAEMNELIDYDSTCLYKRLSVIAYKRLFGMGAEPGEDAFESIYKSLAYVEARIGDDGFLVDGTLSVADVVLASSFSLLVVIPEIDIANNYPCVHAWLQHLHTLGDYKQLVAPFNGFAVTKLYTESEDA